MVGYFGDIIVLVWICPKYGLALCEEKILAQSLTKWYDICNVVIWLCVCQRWDLLEHKDRLFALSFDMWV